MTLQEYLDGGGKLVPIASTPFAHTSFGIGYFANGRPHIHFRERYSTRLQCQQAINELMEQYISGCPNDNEHDS